MLPIVVPMQIEGEGWSWLRTDHHNRPWRPFGDWRLSSGFTHEPPVTRFVIEHCRQVVADAEREPVLLDVGARFGYWGLVARRCAAHYVAIDADRSNVVAVRRRIPEGEVIHERVPFDGFETVWRSSDVVKLDIDGAEVHALEDLCLSGPRAVTIEIHAHVDRRWVRDVIGRFEVWGFDVFACTEHRSRSGTYEPVDQITVPDGAFHLGAVRR